MKLQDFTFKLYISINVRGSAMTTELEERLVNIEIALEKAAKIERMLSNTHRKLLDAKAHWPEYIYDADDRKDQEPEAPRSVPSAKDIDFFERVIKWFSLLGTDKGSRTVLGKKIIWAKACGFSYRQIAAIAGRPPKTCENWYKQDLGILAKKIVLV